MARNGSGTYNLHSSNPVTTLTDISSADFNSTMTDIATAMTGSIARDGQSPATANIPLGANKLTGVAVATAVTDATTLANFQAQTGVYSATVAGTADVITIAPSPALAAYAAGNKFSFIASGDNTTNVTINVSTLGAKAVTKRGANALVAGDIQSSSLVIVQYDGTQFQILSPIGADLGLGDLATQNDSDNLALSGNNTMAGNNNITITAGTITGITDLTVADGGTGASTHTANSVLIGEGTSAISSVAPSTSGNILTSNGTVWQSTAPASSTRVALASVGTGTEFGATSLPSTSNKHTIWVSALSTDGSEELIIQLGDATTGGFITTGYLGSTIGAVATDETATSEDAGHLIETTTATASMVRQAKIVVELIDEATDLYSIVSWASLSSAVRGMHGYTEITLAGHIDRWRILTRNTPDNFDAGNYAYMHES